MNFYNSCIFTMNSLVLHYRSEKAKMLEEEKATLEEKVKELRAQLDQVNAEKSVLLHEKEIKEEIINHLTLTDCANMLGRYANQLKTILPDKSWAEVVQTKPPRKIRVLTPTVRSPEMQRGGI